MSLSALQELNAVPRSAISRRTRIAYTNGYGEPSIRVIEPLRIYQGRNGYTYLRAYCNLRDQERTFRLDRIRSWEQNGWEQRGAGDEEKRGNKQTHAVPQSPLIPFPQPPRSIPQAVVSGGTAPPARPQNPAVSSVVAATTAAAAASPSAISTGTTPPPRGPTSSLPREEGTAKTGLL